MAKVVLPKTVKVVRRPLLVAKSGPAGLILVAKSGSPGPYLSAKNGPTLPIKNDPLFVQRVRA